MSKDIIIQEGGTGRQLSVDKLRTHLVGGGTCLWVPEDGVKLGKKTIRADGTYPAADEGLYGFSQVTVRGIGKATGKGEDGNEYTVAPDASGRLAFKKIASSIRITENPDKMSYAVGEILDYTGIVVTAYDANGESMGAIPFTQLEFPLERVEGNLIGKHYRTVDNALRAVQLDTLGIYTASGSLAYIYPFPLGYRHHSSDGLDWGTTIGSYYVPAPATLLATRYNGTTFMARIDENGGDFHLALFEQDPSTGVWSMYGGTSASIPYNEFSSGGVWDIESEIIPTSSGNPTGYRPGDMVLADAALIVPVQWTRPEDGAVLTTDFEIDIPMS